MEETENLQVRLNHRKESTVPLASESTTPDSRLVDTSPGAHVRGFKTYPFALVLRLRVLQIVCGISAMVMGTVAFIEERGRFNLGLGIPAGAATVLAAAASIHTSRGFGGYRPSSCTPESPWFTLRFLGPSARIAGLLAALWGTACSLHAAVLFLAVRTLAVTSSEARDPQSDHLTTTTSASHNLAVLAAVHITLSALTLVVVITVLRVDCRYDPD